MKSTYKLVTCEVCNKTFNGDRPYIWVKWDCPTTKKGRSRNNG